MRGEQAAAGESRRPLRLFGPALTVALAAAVAAPVLIHGGFTAASRSIFIGLALISLAIAIARDERPLAALARSPVIVCLAAIGGLSVASAAWTVAEPGDALRAGLVVGAVAAVALVSGWVTRAHGVRAIAGVIVGLALAEAAAGLVSAATQSEPWAQRIGGSWRPGGTFEYPPALVILQISALPAFAWAMVQRRRALALAGAAGAAMAGMVLGLGDSRVGIALALSLLFGAVAAAPSFGLARRRVVVLVLVPVGAGIGAHLLQGGYSNPLEGSEGVGGVVALGAVIALGVVAWAFLRDGRENIDFRRKPDHWRDGVTRRRLALGVTAALTAIVATAAVSGLSAGSSGAGVEPVSGFDHGRTAEWALAFDVATDRPVAGLGADSYARAAALQEGDDPTTLYAHSLPLEAWAELGTLGLVLVVGLYVNVGMLLWRLRRDPRAWLFAPAVAAFMLANLVDWQWHLAGAAAIWAMALGACLALDAFRSPALPPR